MSIFKDNVSYRPFSYSWAVEAEKKHRIDMHWHENQVELQDDLRQYTSKDGLATKNVSHASNKNLLDRLVMLFTEMDAQVGSGYGELIYHVNNNEIKTMWFTFAAREVTHQRSYALSAETFGFTNSSWSDFKKYSEMQDKIDLLSEDVGDLAIKLNFAKKLASVLLGEGIALFGAFACLLNLSRFGLVLNFNTINQWSLKDEQEHVRNNIRVLEEVRKDLTEAENIELDKYIKLLVGRYVDAEHTFLDLVFEMGDQEQMTKQDAKDFISYLGELRLYQMGLNNLSDVRENPLDWIDYILTGSTHTNFFESRVVDYSHSGLSGDVDYSKYKVLLDERID
jgi:ribonucleotide reductase beta subunit family protein with ferritin-like domain